MDWRWPRVAGFGLCLVIGIAATPEVPSVGIPLLTLGAQGLLNEQRIFMEEQRFEHEKFLREMHPKSRQLQQPDEVEMLHLLEDFWTARDEV
jgi:hypothetical protein